MIRVGSIKQLKREAKDGADFVVLLANGLLKSSKWIRWDTEEHAFYVYHEIDGKLQKMSESCLLGKSLIGEALTSGMLYKC